MPHRKVPPRWQRKASLATSVRQRPSSSSMFSSRTVFRRARDAAWLPWFGAIAVPDLLLHHRGAGPAARRPLAAWRPGRVGGIPSGAAMVFSRHGPRRRRPAAARRRRPRQPLAVEGPRVCRCGAGLGAAARRPGPGPGPSSRGEGDGRGAASAQRRPGTSRTIPGLGTPGLGAAGPRA